MILPFIFLFILGCLPSFVWLGFYLREDVHPEPKGMVIKIFLLGMICAFIAAGIGLILSDLLSKFHLSPILFLFCQVFIIVALIEEIVKYLPLKLFVLNDPEFDEPIDAMIYMIISGLGFAAIENILFLVHFFETNLEWSHTLLALFGRFISATFLHALCSANIGYFLALSFLKRKNWFFFFSLGVLISTFLHGIYDFGIKMSSDSFLNFWPKNLFDPILLSVFVIFLLIFTTFYQFKKIKKLKSVCEL